MWPSLLHKKVGLRTLIPCTETSRKILVYSASLFILALLVAMLTSMRLQSQTAGPPNSSAQKQTPSSPPAAKQNATEATKPEPPANPEDESPAARRRKQMSEESTQLLNLAMALKAEVDKTNKDMLSLQVIRKADAIEHLARTMRQNLRQ